MTAGVRTSNLPLGNLVEVIGNSDAGGGTRSVARMPIAMFVAALRDLVSGDPTGVAGLVQQLSEQGTEIQSAQGLISDLQQALDAIDTALLKKLELKDLTVRFTGLDQADAALGGRIDDLRQSLNQKAGPADLTALSGALQSLIAAEAKSRGVDIGALKADIAGEARARIAAVTDSFSYTDAETARAKLAEAGLTDALAQERAARLAAPASNGRPGDSPDAYTLAGFSGPMASLPPLPASAIVISDGGATARLQGAGILAMRAPIVVIDRITEIDFDLRRLVDVADPSNHAVVCFIVWLDREMRRLPGTVAVVVVSEFGDLTVASGRQPFRTTVGPLGSAALHRAPYGAVYARAFVQTFGEDGETAVEVLSDRDLTDAVMLPDLSADALARIAAYEADDVPARLSALEAEVGTPSGLPFATRASAALANVPASVSTLITRGLYAAGDGLGAQYRRVTAAAAGAGPAGAAFTTADGAWWLRVDGSVHLTDLDDGLKRLFSRQGLFVADYGIYPGLGITPAQIAANTLAVAAAIADAILNKIPRVYLPYGDFVVGQNGSYKKFSGVVIGADNLTVYGQGTRLWLSGSSLDDYCGAFAWVGCTGTCGLDGDIVIDQLNPAMGQGTVVALTANYVDVLFDWAPTWNVVRQVLLRADDEEGWQQLVLFCDQQAYPRSITKVQGLTYRIDISANSLLPAYLNNFSAVRVGSRVGVGHTRYGCDAFEAMSSEKVRWGEGVVLHGAAGAGLYAVGSGIDWRGAKIVPRLRNGKQDYSSTAADGVHALGCGADWYFLGEVWGTTDDAANMIAVDLAVVQVVDARTLVLATIEEASTVPLAGQDILLLDGTKYPHGVYRILTAQAVSGGTRVTLASDMPAGVDKTFKVSNVTTSTNYGAEPGSKFGLSGAVGVRYSAWRIRLRGVYVFGTMYEGVQSGSFTGSEYTPFDIADLEDLLLVKTCLCTDPTRAQFGGGIAAVAIRPRLDDDQTVVQRGAVGRVYIRGLTVIDCRAMTVYVAGAAKLIMDGVTGENIATAAQPIDAAPAYAFAQIVNTAEAEVTNCNAFGTNPANLNLVNSGRVKIRSVENIAVPLGGAEVIDADTGWIDYVSTVGGENQAVAGPGSTAYGEYQISRKTVVFTGRATGTNGTMSGGMRFYPPPQLANAIDSGFIGQGINLKTGKPLIVQAFLYYFALLNEDRTHPVAPDGTFDVEFSITFRLTT